MSKGGDTVTSGPPEWMTPYLKDYYSTAKQTASLPYQPYTGQQVSDMNPYTTAGLNATAQRALQGSPTVGAANTQLQNTMNGMYSGYQAPANQQAGAYNPNASAYNPNANVFNPMAGAQNTQANAYNSNANMMNQFAGSNPYLSNMIDQSSADVTRNYNLAAKPQLESSMVRSGSFGNSGLQEMQQNQQSDLQRNLGDLSKQYRFADYTTQQGLDENRLQRMYGAGAQTVGNQFQAGRDMQNQLYGAGATQAGNQFSAGQSLANQLYGAGQQQAQNLYGAGENLANRQDSAYQQERARQIQGISLAPQIAGQDYIDAAALTGAGDRFGAQNQQLLDTQYKNFLEARNYPREQLATLSSAFGGYNPGSTQTGPGTSGAATGLGGALTLASILGGGK